MQPKEINGRFASIPIEQRFWAKVEKTNTCWLWLGSKVKGYGQFWLNGKLHLAHRVSYETIHSGNIPNGMVLDHICKNHSCVNPEHLRVVTQRENISYGDSPVADNIHKTHCPQGHPYNDENTIIRNGHRYCRECKKISDRKRRAQYPEKMKKYRLDYYYRNKKTNTLAALDGDGDGMR